MIQIIGAFTPPEDGNGVESLTLRFSPSSTPLQQRWRNNGLSADFLADYVATFFPRDETDPASEARRGEIRGAVSYIANELLENAMKYSSDALTYCISIQLQLNRERVAFWEANSVDAAQAEQFRRYAERLVSGDHGAMYLEQLERSATGEESGLGFLTMMNDYNANLAWKFEPDGSGGVTVTTHVAVAI